MFVKTIVLGYNKIKENVMEKFIIIDGNSLINRAFYALPPLKSADGHNYNAVYGFVNILSKLITENKPKWLCVAFDAGKHTFRNDMYNQYKANRKGMPDDLASQLPVLKDLLNKMNIRIIEQLGIEADDIIGTLAKKSNDCETIIVTGDRDSLQLIDSNITVWLTKKGITDIEVMNEASLLSSWGLKPSQIIDLKAIMGDASDNIPGVKGIGEKGAFTLLEKYSTVENIYAHLDEIGGKLADKLKSDKNMCELSYKLATIDTNSNIAETKEDCTYPFPWDNAVFEEFSKLEFRSLIKRTELFSGNMAHEPIVEAKNKDITLDEAQPIISKVKSFAIVFMGEDLHFCTDKATNYCINLLGLSKEMALTSFTKLLSNQNLTMYTCELKKFIHICENANIKLACKCIDVGIGMYLLNSNFHDSSVDKMLTHFGLQASTPATSVLLAWDKVSKALEEKGLNSLYYDIELPLVWVLQKMERIGVNVDINVLNELKPKYAQEIKKLEQDIWDYAGVEFNVNSPKQLGEILFDKLKMPPSSKKRSTAVDVLEGLQNFHPIIDAILRYRTVSKLYSTYIEGLLPYIRSDHKIHTIFNQTMAVTGRLSSLEPNLQNIPVRTPEGKEIRRMFVASKNNVLLSADYSQIELRLLAHYSKDEVLINAFKNHSDIHAVTASQIFNTSLESVTESMRRCAKAVNFGIIYGISPFGLANNLKIPQSVAKEYIERYFMTYPTIKTFLDSSVEKYKKDGFVSTMFGRIRNFSDVVASNYDSRFSARAAMNMPLQGSASDIIKLAMLSLDEEITKLNLKSKMILQIHDELIFDVPQNEVETMKKLVKEKMENVVSLLVPLEVDIQVGKNWSEL